MKEKQDNVKISDLWSNIHGLKRAVLNVLLLSAIIQVLNLAFPFYLQLVIDDALVRQNNQILLILALGFSGLVLIQFFTEVLRSWSIMIYGNLISFQIVANIFHHLIRLPNSYFEKRHVGDIISRMRSVTPIQKALTESIVAAIIDGFMAIVTIAILFWYNAQLALIVLGTVSAMIALTLVLYPHIKLKQEQAIVNEAEEQTFSIETIKAAQTIKLFSAEDQRENIWRNLFANYINSNISLGKYNLIHSTVQSLIQSIQIVLVVYFGAKAILSENQYFTVGMLFAFMAFRQSFTNSSRALLEKLIEFRLVNLHLDRLSDIIRTEKEVVSTRQSRKKIKGGLSIRNLSFRYSPYDPWVIRDLNFDVKNGEFVAIMGTIRKR